MYNEKNNKKNKNIENVELNKKVFINSNKDEILEDFKNKIKISDLNVDKLGFPFTDVDQEISESIFYNKEIQN